MRGTIAAASRRSLGRFLLFFGGLTLVWMVYAILTVSPRVLACCDAASPPVVHASIRHTLPSHFPVVTGIVIVVVCLVGAFLIYRPRRSPAESQ
jgi:hypothetical protein